MRIPIIILVLALVAIISASLLIRDSFLVGVVTVLIMIPTLGISIYATCRKSLQLGKLSLVFLGLLPLAFLGLTNTPLKVAFTLLEPKFDELGQQMARGDAPAFPRWVGPFRIEDGGIRKSSGDPYLMTGGHRYEISGFVRNPKGEGFNLWSLVTLGDQWSYIVED